MPYFRGPILKKRRLRAIIAAVFAIVLLAEWGSHGVACAHDDQAGGEVVSVNETTHDDPCDTLITCPDNRQHDQRGSSIDPTRHNVVFQRILGANLTLGIAKPPVSERDRIDRLFRPFDPPFHPPELF